MNDTVKPKVRPPNYTDREISGRLEKAGVVRKTKEVKNKRRLRKIRKINKLYRAAIKELESINTPLWIIDVFKMKIQKVI